MHEQVTAALIAREFVAVEKVDYTWCFRFSQKIRVLTEGVWRLVGPEGTLATSTDHGHKFGLPEPFDAVSKASSILTGTQVEDASINVTTGDLQVRFTGSMRLEFLQTSTGYESWRLYARGLETICTGGGTIVSLPDDAPNSGNHST